MSPSEERAHAKKGIGQDGQGKKEARSVRCWQCACPQCHPRKIYNESWACELCKCRRGMLHCGDAKFSGLTVASMRSPLK